MKFILKIVFLFLLTISLGFAQQKITVLLDWFANPSHAPLFVALEKGFFKDQGLDVELIGPADPSDPPKLVAAEQADIAITYEPQFIDQISAGLPLIRIGTLINKPLNCLVTLKENTTIKSIKDLKNKKIGYSSGGVTTIALKTLLENNGLRLQDVHSINVHYDLSQALLSRKVDAVTGMMRTFEVIQLTLLGHPVNAFFPEDYGVPTYDELIFVIHKKNLSNPIYFKFLTAVQQGAVYLRTHPEECWKSFAKNHPELNDELNKRAWFATLPFFAKDPFYFNPLEWQKFIVFMLKNGLIKDSKPLNQYAVNLKNAH